MEAKVIESSTVKLCVMSKEFEQAADYVIAFFGTDEERESRDVEERVRDWQLRLSISLVRMKSEVVEETRVLPVREGRSFEAPNLSPSSTSSSCFNELSHCNLHIYSSQMLLETPGVATLTDY